MQHSTFESISLTGRKIQYTLVHSKSAKKLRVRIGINGVEVFLPFGRSKEELLAFLTENEQWIAGQLERVEKLKDIRRPDLMNTGEILFHGEPSTVTVAHSPARFLTNLVEITDEGIVIWAGKSGKTHPAKSLENQLRKRVRIEIESWIAPLNKKLRVQYNKLFIMGQRTKWGNCSNRGNLSFNWRLIMAPPFVLQYIVTHEVVHLAIPDHSQKFWLTVQSLCPQAEHAKQWLSANGYKLQVDLKRICNISMVLKVPKGKIGNQV